MVLETFHPISPAVHTNCYNFLLRAIKQPPASGRGAIVLLKWADAASQVRKIDRPKVRRVWVLATTAEEQLEET
jgi:hypothetical protein